MARWVEFDGLHTLLLIFSETQSHEAHLISIPQCLRPRVHQRECVAPLDEDSHAIHWVQRQYSREIFGGSNIVLRVNRDVSEPL